MIKALLILTTLLFTSSVLSNELPTIRLGALAYGTVNWELDTIKNNKLDEKHGFKLEVIPMGGGSASDSAFLCGEIEVMEQPPGLAVERVEPAAFAARIKIGVEQFANADIVRIGQFGSAVICRAAN